MSSKDDDIKKLHTYAKSLGVKIKYKKGTINDGDAEWDLVTNNITVFTFSSPTKTDIILCLLHEIGHHLDWIHNDKKVPLDTDRALLKLCSGNMHGSRPDLTKKDLEVILREEIAGIHYMDIIHKELRLKLPLWRTKAQQVMDCYQYEFLYRHGRFPTTSEFLKKNKRVMKQFKNKYTKVKK